MSRIFLGKPLHWLVLVIVFGILWWMGSALMQTRNYHLFLLILFVSVAGAVGVIIATSRKGERITREPFDDEPGDG